MRTLLLRLEGPLQSWGTQGRFSERDTDAEPSKSGVMGLLGAAIGMEREDEAGLARLNSLEMVVRVDREGRVLRDFHTAGAGTLPSGEEYRVWGTDDPVVTKRYYLMDASFVVALAGEDALIGELESAIRNPRYMLCLGRRGCVPSEPLLIGVVERPVADAAREAPWAQRMNESAVRLLLESPEGAPRMDVALSFRLGARRFTRRFVRTEWVEVPTARAEEQTR